ncbi:MAG: hypothetical protein ACOYNC_12060 [Bacteroidales bacterium]
MRRVFLIILATLSLPGVFGQTINRIEYFFDTDPGYGSAIPVSYSAGSSVTATFNLNTAGLSQGIHVLLVRAKNVNGKWSTVSNVPVYVIETGSGSPVVKLEYYIDNDPGFGYATTVTIVPGTAVPASFQVNTNGLTPGLHYLCVRAKDSQTRWSTLSWSMFVVQEVESNISKLEYYVDADPGFGSGKPLTIVPGSKITSAFSIDTAGLVSGLHMLCVRAKDTRSRWSLLSSSMFVVQEKKSDISKVEYFVDNEPGFGSGTPLTFTPGSKISAAFAINTPSLLPGMHYLCVRSMDSQSRWSALQYYPFVSFSNGLIPEITEMEYFVDTDPGFGLGIQVPVTPGQKVSAAFSPSLPALAEGLHMICVRVKNSAGQWSMLQSYMFSTVQDTKRPMTVMEYFVDTDPGFGSGHPVAITPSNAVTAQFSPDTTGLPLGGHMVVVRVKDGAGNWSIVHDTTFNYNSTPRTWTGLVSEDWKVPGNWSPEGVPQWNDDILIPAVAPFMPVVKHAGLSCRKVVVSPGGELHINPGVVLTVNGDLKLIP